MRLTFALAAPGIAAIASAIAAFSFSAGAHAATVNVDTGNYYFCAPANSGSSCETNTTVGDTVTWTVSSGTHHIVQCTDGTFATCTGPIDLGSFSTGQSKSQTLSVAGDFYYHCAFHPDQMKGEISAAAVVTSSPSPTLVASQTAAVTATPASVPKTGGPPDDGGSDAWQYVLLGAGGMLVIGATVAFVYSRWRR